MLRIATLLFSLAIAIPAHASLHADISTGATLLLLLLLISPWLIGLALIVWLLSVIRRKLSAAEKLRAISMAAKNQKN